MKRSAVLSARNSRGKNVMLRYLDGEKITRSDAIHAKCFVCSAGYEEGLCDCGKDDCPLYPYMPYRSKVHKSGVNTSKPLKHRINQTSD